MRSWRLKALRDQETLTVADDRSMKDARDRNRVSSEEPYEVQYLAERTGISIRVARELIKRFGNDRRVLEKEALKLKARPTPD